MFAAPFICWTYLWLFLNPFSSVVGLTKSPGKGIFGQWSWSNAGLRGSPRKKNRVIPWSLRENQRRGSEKFTTKWFKVTFLFPSWRSLDLWRGHLTIPKRSQSIARYPLFFLNDFHHYPLMGWFLVSFFLLFCSTYPSKWWNIRLINHCPQ